MVLWTVQIPLMNVGVTIGFARVSNLKEAIRQADEAISEREEREARERLECREDGAGGVFHPGA